MKGISFEVVDKLFVGYDTLDHESRLERIFQYVGCLPFARKYDFPLSVGLLVIAAIREGTDPNHLSSFCGVPLESAQEVANRMTAAGMWHSDGSVDYEFLAAKTQLDWAFDVALTLTVGEGALVVTGRKENGEREFKVTDSGLWDCADLMWGMSARFQ